MEPENASGRLRNQSGAPRTLPLDATHQEADTGPHSRANRRTHYQLSTLPNGLRVITENMPSVRSIAVGCWVDTGTRDEMTSEAGASHFLEHLLFKGSERYSARFIAESFDAIGAGIECIHVQGQHLLLGPTARS